MKKLLSAILCAALLVSVCALTSYAGEVLYSNDFSSALDENNWVFGHAGASWQDKVADGQLVVGNNSDWTAVLVDANLKTAYDNVVYSFDYKGTPKGIYTGFGVRAPEGRTGELYGGGRAGAGGATDNGYGISFDMFSSTNANKIIVAFNNGAMGNSQYFSLDYPQGYTVETVSKITINDFEDEIAVFINGAELVTLKLSALSGSNYTSVTAYKGSAEIGTLTGIVVPTRGCLSFYQRASATFIDNLRVETKTAAEKTSSVSLDSAQVLLKDGKFSFKITFRGAASFDTWFGVYPASVTAPTSADSIGTWCYATGTREVGAATPADGTIVFNETLCNDISKLALGDYKVFMFTNDSDKMYEVLDVATFSFVDKIETPATGDPVVMVVLLLALSCGAITILKRAKAQ